MLLVASIFLAFIIILMIQEINDKNKNIKIESNPENAAIERMVQESLLVEKQKTQKNKSHLVKHRNNLFDDDYTTDHVYGFIPDNISYNDEDYHYYPDNDNHYSDDDNIITSPAYSSMPGNVFYHEP